MVLGESWIEALQMFAGDDYFHSRVELFTGSCLHKVYSDMCTARYGDRNQMAKQKETGNKC